jgi:hypothetical protein
LKENGMTVQNFDRMALNAAMDLLASGREAGWVDAAEAIIDFGITLPESPQTISESQVYEHGTGDRSVTGYSSGHGNVEYSEKEKSNIQIKSTGAYERVGHYRVYHFPIPKIVMFRHFRESGAFQNFDEVDEVRDGGTAVIYDDSCSPRFLMRVLSLKVQPPVWERVWGEIRRRATLLSWYFHFLWKKTHDPALKGSGIQLTYQLVYYENVYVVIYSREVGIGPGDICSRHGWVKAS